MQWPAASSHIRWVEALQQCRQHRDLQQAKRLHALLQQQQLELHPVLGNYLVPLLADCGDLGLARHLFDHLPCRNEYSWTSLISGYLEHDDPNQAYCLYWRMRQDASVQPNRVTYLALLNSCARNRDAEQGRCLHTDIVLRGLERDLHIDSALIGNTLVDMYGKCGLPADACGVFDQLSCRNVVSWNALIAGYAEHKLAKEAGICVQQMRQEGICPDSVTFICSLKACASIAALQLGRELHMELLLYGLERNVYVGSTLVDMYTKCCSLGDARQVFDRLPDRDTVSWAALIAGYTECGFVMEAKTCFQEMQQQGILPDPFTFVSNLKACGTMRALETGQQLHNEITKRGLETELYVGNALVDLYGKCSSFAESYHVFEKLPSRDAVSWNALITGCARSYELDKDCFRQMHMEGISPAFITFLCSLKVCGIVRAIEKGWKIHTEITKRGFEMEVDMGNTLIDAYGKCGFLAEARQVFVRLPKRDAVSWNALITGYSEHNSDVEVLNCFHQMQLEGMTGDAVTSLLCLKACGTLGALETGREIHIEVRKSGLEIDLYVGNALLDMYGKCGSVTEAREVFDKLPVRNVVSWNAIIMAYGENQNISLALQCFEDMQAQCVKPDSVTFTCLLAACSHSSLLVKGQAYFKVMKEKHEIEPTVEHYACMIDLFARSGHVHEAERFLAAMGCPPSSVTLLAMLSACKIYGKVELGQRCFQQLVEMCQDDASAYLLIADMYASAGRWKDAKKVEEMRIFARAKKKPGGALLEVDKKVHQFVGGVKQGNNTLEMLDFLSLCMKKVGHIPHLDVIMKYDTHEGKETLSYRLLDKFSLSFAKSQHFRFLNEKIISHKCGA